MLPTIGGHSTVLMTWTAATLVAMIVALLLAVRDGHGPTPTYLALLILPVVFVAGTKVHFWLANPELVKEFGLSGLLGYGFHFPGGLVASVMLGPLLLLALGLRPLAFFDSIAPA